MITNRHLGWLELPITALTQGFQKGLCEQNDIPKHQHQHHEHHKHHEHHEHHQHPHPHHHHPPHYQHHLQSYATKYTLF